MPFLTKEGHNKTTLKISLGCNVSMNAIIGMPMTSPAKMSLDLVDNVAESGILNTGPFPVINRPTIQSPAFLPMIQEEHVTLKYVKACALSLSNNIVTADFAKPIPDKSRLNNKVEIVGRT
jgi:hypothetical protein